ncbi:hypothetical protein G6F57_020814 [Rhizopus arrhizus]|nr:hypothetical protein G6F57_020814 [Rhizopus arrhizus]
MVSGNTQAAVMMQHSCLRTPALHPSYGLPGSADQEARADRVVAVDHPARGAQDAGGALDGGPDGARAVQVYLAQQAAFKRAAAQQAFGFDWLVQAHLSTRLEHGRHGAGARAAG